MHKSPYFLQSPIHAPVHFPKVPMTSLRGVVKGGNMNLRASFGLGLASEISWRSLLKSSKQKCRKWWQLKHFWNFHPENWGKMHPFWRSYFSKGWFNHQLVWNFSKPNPKTSFFEKENDLNQATVMIFGDQNVTLPETNVAPGNEWLED